MTTCFILAVCATVSAQGATLWANAYELREQPLAIPQSGVYDVWFWVDAEGAHGVTINEEEIALNTQNTGWIKAGSVRLQDGPAAVVPSPSVAAVAFSTYPSFDPSSVLPDVRVLDTPRPVDDRRRERAGHTDHVYTMPHFSSKAEWELRAGLLRKRILVGSGLLPMPKGTPLNAEISEKVQRDDYAVEKVRFEVTPGFYCTGNLYTPVGEGPFPAVASPHGHWDLGRLENSEIASVPGRCITLARMGMVAFSYDMIGSVDSLQFPHNWGGKREKLWGIHPFAFQLYTSMRALDFLESLPYVDGSRLAVSGASGGGTQTFAVTAVDNRVKVAAPVNMISRNMQGGCVCENAPLLRLDNSSIEIGALTAPRPLLMVSTSGDWTAETPREEFPAMRSIYDLYGAADRVENRHFDYAHNYNRDSRTAVYRFLGKWLLLDAAKWQDFTEPPFKVESTADLRVYPDGKLPDGMQKKDEIIARTIEARKAKWAAVLPSAPTDMASFRENYGSLLGVVLNAEVPEINEIDPERTGRLERQGHILERWVLHRPGKGDAIPALAYLPKNKFPADAVLIVHGQGKAALADTTAGGPGPLIAELLAQDKIVVTIDAFLTGEHHSPYARTEREELVRHFTDPESWLNVGDYWIDDAFRPTTTAYRVQDVLTAASWLRNRRDATGTVDLVGLGDAGMWCLFAAALDSDIRRTWIEANQFDTADDAAWVEKCYVPSLRAIGDITTAAAMVAPRPLWVSNTGNRFDAEGVIAMYRAADADTLALSQGPAEASEIAAVFK